MSDLERITELMQSRPGPHAPPSAVAAWYERKAELLDSLASSEEPQAAWAKAQAVLARQHARTLSDRAA